MLVMLFCVVYLVVTVVVPDELHLPNFGIDHDAHHSSGAISVVLDAYDRVYCKFC